MTAELDARLLRAVAAVVRVLDGVNVGNADLIELRAAYEALAATPPAEGHGHGPDCLDCVALSRATVMAFAIETGLAKGPDDVTDVVRGVVARMVEP